MTIAGVQLTHRPGEARPEWLQPFPVEWETLLRTISPITDRVSYLWPRWREDYEMWMLYEVTPKALLSKDRIAQLSVHWSDLPKGEQMGRRASVSEYQFWMFRTHGLEARPFWCLQGTKFIQGGTPFAFTSREEKLLQASGFEHPEPVPPGLLPNVPFDNRVVRKIVARDRLLKVDGSLDQLAKQSRPDYLKAEDEETERQYRKAFLAWNHEQNESSVEFMRWYRHQDEYDDTLAPAPEGLANQLVDWQDRYIETGSTGGGSVTQRKVQVAVR